MATSLSGESIPNQHRLIKSYYRQHASIYQMTRWSFLFGRKHIVQSLGNCLNKPQRILEVGCGTGHNLINLAKTFPEASITGVDLSPNMIDRAEERTVIFGSRVQVFESPFLHDGPHTDNFWDAILFSYTLSMINPQWQSWIEHTHHLLNKGGCIGVVDFHNTPYLWFSKHMNNHHVRMDGHLQRELNARFHAKMDQIQKAYGGLWNYFSFIGYKV